MLNNDLIYLYLGNGITWIKPTFNFKTLIFTNCNELNDLFCQIKLDLITNIVELNIFYVSFLSSTFFYVCYC